MALVPYRVSGAAADQSSETRLFQIGSSTITIHQQASGSLRQGASGTVDPPLDVRPSSPSRGRVQLCVCRASGITPPPNRSMILLSKRPSMECNRHVPPVVHLSFAHSRCTARIYVLNCSEPRQIVDASA